MADRYWVGGTGTWSEAATANWSASSGGAGGASAPTIADNVFFDANSFTASSTVTLSGAPACRDWSVDGVAFPVVFSTPSATTKITIKGSIDHVDINNRISFSTTANATMTLSGEGFITTPNVNYGAWQVFIDTSTGTAKYSVYSALTFTSGSLYLYRGVLDTRNALIKVRSFVAGNQSNSPTDLRLGSSTMEVTESCLLLKQTATNVVDAGTSTIKVTSSGALGGLCEVNNDGFKLHDVMFTSTAAGTARLKGTTPGIYNNITFASPSAAGTQRVAIIATSATVNGKLVFGENNAPNRSMVVTAELTPRVLTVNEVGSLSNVTFYGVEAQGASAPWEGTRLGDGGRNKNIIFEAGRTRYWYSAGQAAAIWHSASWVNSTGDTAGSLENIPLAQDTAVFRDMGLASGAQLTSTTTQRVDVKTIDASARTLPMDFNFMGEVYVGKDVVLSTASTWSTKVNTLFMSGVGDMRVFAKGKTFGSLTFYSDSPATLTFEDSVTGTGTLKVAGGGTLRLRGVDTTIPYLHLFSDFNASNTISRTVDFGTSPNAELRLNGSNKTVYSCSVDTGLVFLGVPVVRLMGAPTTGTRSVWTGTNRVLSDVTQPLLYVEGGSDTLSVYYSMGSLILADAFSGTLANTIRNISKDFRLSPSTKLTTGTNETTFFGTDNSTFEPSGVTINFTVNTNKGSSEARVYVSSALSMASGTQCKLTRGYLRFKAGTVNTMTLTSLSTAYKGLESDVPGVAAYVQQDIGSVNMIAATITDIIPRGAATFNAYTNSGVSITRGNVNGGNTEGWKFIPPGMTMLSFG